MMKTNKKSDQTTPIFKINHAENSDQFNPILPPPCQRNSAH